MKTLILALAVACTLSAAVAGVLPDAPTRLRTDLLEHTAVLRQSGHLLSTTLADTPLPPPEAEYARIQSSRPTFSWHTPAGIARATLCRIIVSSSIDAADSLEADVWDSGIIPVPESGAAIYGAAEPLSPSSTYFWRVKLLTADSNVESSWSAPGAFRTAPVLDEFAVSDYPLRKRTDLPVYTRNEADTAMFADFGRDAFSQLLVTVASPRADTLTVCLAERLDSCGSVLRHPQSSVRFRSISLPIHPGTHSYRVEIAPDRRNTGPEAILMPLSIGEVLPFRYCLIEGLSPGVDICSVSREAVTYPFCDTASSFHSSDSVLNAVWDLCKYSIEATSFAGLYVDGDRERIPYEADAFINQLCHYGVDDSYAMARSTFEHLLQHPTWPTEWILCMPLIAWEDYMYTADTRLLRKHYSRLKANLLMPLRTSIGLVSTTLSPQTPELLASIGRTAPLRDIVDWPRTKKGENIWDVPGESDGFEFTDYNTVVNAYHYRALAVMALIADAIGENTDADFFRADAEDFRLRFIKAFYDSENHRFADGLLSDTRHSSLHANIFPLAFGMVTDPVERAHVASFIRSRGMACSVYGSQFLMDALYEAGEADYALSLLTDTSSRSWYNMLLTGSTITTEAWDDRYKTNQDWNHAWGAVPANIIPRRLVGVTPIAPGFATALISPQTSTLSSVSATVPTLRGPIEVKATRTPRLYTLTFTLPPTVSGCLRLPSFVEVTLTPERKAALSSEIFPPGTHTLTFPL